MSKKRKPEQPKPEVVGAQPEMAIAQPGRTLESSSTLEPKNDTSPPPIDDRSGEAAPVENEERDRAFTGKTDKVMKSLIRKLYSEVGEFSVEVIDLQCRSETLVKLAKEIDVANTTRDKILNLTESDELPSFVEEIGVHQESENFISVSIPKQWVNTPITIKRSHSGWEINPYPEVIDENIAKLTLSDEQSEELAELRRFKQQIPATLETVMVIAKQIENCAEAMQQGAFDQDEHRGVEILIRSLAQQIAYYLRLHLTVTLEATARDEFF